MRGKNALVSWLGLFLLILIPIIAHSQTVQNKGKSKWPNEHNDCSGNCFAAEIISVTPANGGCTNYEVRVSYTGVCRYGLSHVTMEMPCGYVKNVQAPGGCGNSFGKDPTTGLRGLKIDGPRDFGKGLPNSFIVKFTWCNSSACQAAACWEPRVAFKAATCVDYDTARNACQNNPSLKATTQKKDVTCSGNVDGSLSIFAEGGVGPYTYSWSTGCTSSSIENLPVGTYTVTVKDSEGNEVTLTEEIKAISTMVLSAVPTQPTCFGSANGAVDLSVEGGVQPYSYHWSNGATTQDLSSLAAGTYTVTVVDSVGCSKNTTVQLTSPMITVVAQTVRPSCAQSNGGLDITVSGGTEPYSYLWSNGATSQDVTGLSAGSYSVVVTDAKGCSSRTTYFLTENNTLRISFVVSPTNCFDDSSGAINLTVTGGTAPYTFLWQNGATTEDVSGLPAGLQRVTVTDAAGCTANSVINVFKQAFTVGSQVLPPTCSGDSNGSITLTPQGVAPYTYGWSTGATTPSITNLSSGLYTVTVTDATGCSQVLNYFMTNPVINVFANVTNPQCGTAGAFAIDLTVSGGTAPYTYLWSNGANTQDISGLNAGTYTVNITDANGCGKTFDVMVQPVVVDWSCSITAPTNNPVCGSPGNLLGTAVIGATSYSWSVESDDGQWLITSGQQTSAVVYTAGGNGSSATFSVTISKGGCVQTCSFTVAACAPVMTCGMSPAAPAPGPAPTPQPETKPMEPISPFRLSAYPNPVVDKLAFTWTSDTSEQVQLDLFDFCGKRVAEVYAGPVQAGETYTVELTTSELHDRLYFYRYSSQARTVHGKLFKKN